jgi:hypothetical protein
LLALTASLIVASAALVACSDDGVDRAEAVQRVVAESGGRITPDQAGCYVDRVLDEIGSRPLRPGAEVPPEVNGRLTTIRVDCIGVEALGAPPSSNVEPQPPEGGLPGPKRRGDDVTLDALWDQCAGGFGQACDELFDRAPMGSDYENFGATCGRRTREQQCVAVYPAPGLTQPSEAQPTTTVPPASP